MALNFLNDGYFAGKVGIGTESPDRKLHVKDSAIVVSEFEGTNTGSLLDLVNSNASQLYNGIRFTQGASGKMAITHIADGTTKGYVQIGNSWATGSEILVVDGRTSNVGIGTTSPDALLELSKDASGGQGATLRLTNAVGGSGAGTAIEFVGPGTQPIHAKIITEDTGAFDSNIIFQTKATATAGALADRLTIDNVGAIQFNNYDSTNQTGTPTYLLGTDGSGNIVKTNTIPGSDPGPYLPLAGGIMTGDVRFNDGVEIEVGTSRDLVITHDGSNSYIKQIGTGNLILRQSVDDGDIIFQSDNGSGGVATYFRLDGSLADGTFTFTSWGDNDKVTFGDSNDLQIYHNGSDSYISDTGAGELRISASKTRFYDADLSHLQAEFTDGGSVDLYYSGNKKFETTSTGISVTGQITTTGTSPSVLFNETDVTANWRNRVSSGSYRVQYASDGTTFSDYFVLGASANTVEKDTTFAGDIKIGSALLSNQNNTDVDTGTEAIASVVLATYTAAFFDFVIKKGTNVRSGTVYACHDGTSVAFTETSTQDLGDTSDVTLNVVISTIYLQLQATTTSDDWSVKSLIRAI